MFLLSAPCVCVAVLACSRKHVVGSCPTPPRVDLFARSLCVRSTGKGAGGRMPLDQNPSSWTETRPPSGGRGEGLISELFKSCQSAVSTVT